LNQFSPKISPIYRRIFLLALFLTAVVILILIFPMIDDLIVMLIIALVMTYIFKPGVVYLEHIGVHRAISIMCIFLLGGVLIVLGMMFFIPVLIEEARTLIENIQEVDFAAAYANVIGWIDQRLPGLSSMLGAGPDQAEAWLSGISKAFSQFLGQSTRVLASAVNTLALLSVIPFMVFFFLKDGSRFTKRLIENVPNRYFEMSMSLVYRIDQQLGNYIRSVLVESAIIGVLTWVALEILGVKFAIVLGLLNGLLNSIPFFGPLIAYFPIGLVILITYDPPALGLLWMVIILAAVQIIDNALAKPLLIGRSVDVHPAMVLLAVLIGGKLAGAIGMFIAIPAYKIIQVIIVDSYTHLKRYHLI